METKTLSPNQKKFVKELFNLCQKYKVDICDANMNFYTTDCDSANYSISIAGGWPIRKDSKAVEVFAREDIEVFSLNGTAEKKAKS